MAVAHKIPDKSNQELSDIKAEREKNNNPVSDKSKILVEMIHKTWKKEVKS